MSYGHGRREGTHSSGGDGKTESAGTPGKRTLTDALMPVQRKASGDGVHPDADEAMAKAGSSTGAPPPT
jgi:hypothetical protein